MLEMQGQLGPAKGKDFDTGNILGSSLVTADEVADPYYLTMVARVNDVEWWRGLSSAMQHKFEDIIVHVSADETLHAGEFFGSGTVGGCGLEQARFLKPGDVVELEVQGLGGYATVLWQNQNSRHSAEVASARYFCSIIQTPSQPSPGGLA
jgi:2-keto-4-pentenoate hydratase/2-oxohepta-3-ene-1,7-dioic acid hydratase in catechol pathway